MYLALYTLLIISLTANTITDYIKIKSNKEVIKADREVYEAQKELSNKLDERNKILKESQNLQEKAVNTLEELKVKVSLDYDKLSKEVIRKINKENIIINI